METKTAKLVKKAEEIFKKQKGTPARITEINLTRKEIRQLVRLGYIQTTQITLSTGQKITNCYWSKSW